MISYNRYDFLRRLADAKSLLDERIWCRDWREQACFVSDWRPVDAEE